MPLKYMLRQGMMGQSMTAPELSPDHTYGELVGCLHRFYGQKINDVYYETRDKKIVHLPLAGRSLSLVPINKLEGYDPEHTILTFRLDGQTEEEARKTRAEAWKRGCRLLPPTF